MTAEIRLAIGFGNLPRRAKFDFNEAEALSGADHDASAGAEADSMAFDPIGHSRCL